MPLPQVVYMDLPPSGWHIGHRHAGYSAVKNTHFAFLVVFGRIIPRRGMGLNLQLSAVHLEPHRSKNAGYLYAAQLCHLARILLRPNAHFCDSALVKKGEPHRVLAEVRLERSSNGVARGVQHLAVGSNPYPGAE